MILHLIFLGVISSSVGTILKSCGLSVTAIKIDPYLNIDAGTFSPYEHGNYLLLYLSMLFVFGNCFFLLQEKYLFWMMGERLIWTWEIMKDS